MYSEFCSLYFFLIFFLMKYILKNGLPSLYKEVIGMCERKTID